MHRRQFGSALLSAAAAFSPSVLFAEDERRDAVTKWIRQQAVPLAGVSPELPQGDLKPVKRILAGVQVVGVGENNHGASEYQVFKHRLFRFLVEEMGFTAFALEANHSSCKAIDEYIVNGTGRLEDVLTGQGYTVWDTVEMTALLKWMRAYNQSAKPEKKLRFFGLDIAYNERSRKNVLAWLQQYAPEHASQGKAVLDAMGDEDDKWPGRTDHERVKAMLADIQALAAFVREKSKEVAGPANPMEDAVWDMTVIEQWARSNSGGPDRTQWMGENLNHLLDCYPGMKVLVSAFNSHIAHAPATIGGLAKEKLGKGYYSLASEFGSGSFRVRTKDPDNYFGAYREIMAAAAPEQSVPWYLTQSGKGSLLLDFREASSRKAVADWIEKPQIMHRASWSPLPDDDTVRRFNLADLYDGLYFIDRIRPTQATAHGEASARARYRF